MNFNLLGLPADIPMIEVVAAVLLIFAFPLAERARLMLHHDALLELRVEVPATVPPVHRNQHGVQLLPRVLLRLEHVVRDTRLEVEKCHLLFRRLIIINYNFFFRIMNTCIQCFAYSFQN